ncbi:hypothetical protein PHLGIDRAFT_121736 [Phlebiopsis gigantea 11061_1 CR5-6]|uniref:N-acetyltransferase domain-containing protein n=1 Tax=Phlebiopsis gigantea (strain 11061_1 CR5-6) TaxID=745531 RepID=A0A0C3PDF9_PHLG1|nr:hypothetical protein PHLGIDRAFT_121736 [Phlebiopsis gigantea 11061_1 CR5-6]
MATTVPAVRRIDGSSAADIDAAIAVLLRAFDGDGAIEALTAGRKSAEVALFRRSVEEALRRGECYVAFDGAQACGVAVWLSPRADWRFHEDAAFMEKLPESVLEWYSQHFASKYEELYASTGVDSTVARRDSWKLQWLGVTPDHRRRGIGRALIQAVATKADEGRQKIVAEVTNPQTVNHLQRCGFKYKSVKNLTSRQFTGFPMWYLVREPSSSRPTPSASSGRQA